MAQEITFNSVMKNHKNWPEDIDFVAMEESYFKLKKIMDKMFFEEYPKHPEYFVKLFCQEDFADTLLNKMVLSGITNLNKVWFKECSEEEKAMLIEKGAMTIIPTLLHCAIVILCRNKDDFFVNLVP